MASDGMHHRPPPLSALYGPCSIVDSAGERKISVTSGSTKGLPECSHRLGLVVANFKR